MLAAVSRVVKLIVLEGEHLGAEVRDTESRCSDKVALQEVGRREV
jgi:hypothetical protein